MLGAVGRGAIDNTVKTINKSKYNSSQSSSSPSSCWFSLRQVRYQTEARQLSQVTPSFSNKPISLMDEPNKVEQGGDDFELFALRMLSNRPALWCDVRSAESSPSCLNHFLPVCREGWTPNRPRLWRSANSWPKPFGQTSSTHWWQENANYCRFVFIWNMKLSHYQRICIS